MLPPRWSFGAYAERIGAEEGHPHHHPDGAVDAAGLRDCIRRPDAIGSGACHHARHRSVFQKHLADQPLMQAVLSDMALHIEASVALVTAVPVVRPRARRHEATPICGC